ncbi:MAG TPA: PEP-CTERM sorting domain-containing protein [Stellaceae bacterium]|nr:PEP-CTERM sorting domain-containing protein [Stellaceae bacterium]
MNTQKLIATTATALLFMGAVSANAVASSSSLSVSMSYTVTPLTPTSTGGAPTPTVTKDLASPTSFSTSSPLSTTGLVTVSPGSCSGCNSSSTISETVDVDFSFIDGNNATGSLNTDFVFTDKWGGSELSCSNSGTGDTDCIVWAGSSGGSVLGQGSVTDDIDLTDGAVVALTLDNAQDWTITSDISATMTYTAPPTVPEPASMVLFASGLLGLPFVRRRLGRGKAQATTAAA